MLFLSFIEPRSGGCVAQEWPREYTPRPRLGVAAKKKYPTSKVKETQVKKKKKKETQVRW